MTENASTGSEADTASQPSCKCPIPPIRSEVGSQSGPINESSVPPPASSRRSNERLRTELRALAPYLAGLGDARGPAFITFAKCAFTPTGTVPQFPVELIHEIVSFTDPAVFKELAESRLYEDLEFSDCALVEMCFQTICDHPDSSKHIRRVALRQANLHPEELSGAFRSLCGMPNLTSLHLEFTGSIGEHLRGSKFRLTFLVIVCDWDRTFVEWLADQTELRSFVYWGLPEPGIKLPDQALPKLSHVVGAPSLACVMVPGRPVREVLISYATTNASLEPTIEFVWQHCAQSAGPVEIVNVRAAIQNMNAMDLMAYLGPIPDYLPGLLWLNIQVLKSGISKEACDYLCAILSKMKKLEALFMYSRLREGYFGDHDNQREIVTG